METIDQDESYDNLLLIRINELSLDLPAGHEIV